MVMVGLAFKLSAVPFHFWCPDVFEGATAEVNAFLSVASKGAALALLVRVAFGMGHLPGDSARLAVTAPAGVVGEGETVMRPVSFAAQKAEVGGRTAEDSLAPVRGFMARMIAFIAIITCTFGNLAAYGQSNIKRMLAYSTIAHAGYMMMPVAAALVLMGQPGKGALAERAVASILFYVAVYLFMNLGAFAVVAILRNKLRSEQISDYAGLVRRAPTIVVCFSIILFSLVGMPPLAGFAGKFLIFFSLKDADWIGWTLLVVAAVNTVLSLFYYLRVIKVMTIDPEPEDRLPVDFSPLAAETVYVLGITIPVVVFGILFGGLLAITREAAGRLLS
jgi:NADH-quinone oxidoreductase subunit N